MTHRTPGEKEGDGMTTDPNDDSTVRDLLRRAGRRPAVPDAIAAQVKAAAEAQWEWTVRGEQRRRRGRATGAALALAAGLVLAIGLLVRWPGTAPAVTVATVESLDGQLLADGVAVDLGAALVADVWIETAAEPAGLALLRLGAGETGVGLRLDAGTRLRLLDATRVELDTGAIYADTDGAPSDEPKITIETIHGSVRDIGTRFEVRIGDAVPLRVRVRDGRIVLDHASGRSTADAGVELTLRADGEVVEAPIPLHGDLWSWTLDVLPAFDTEGRTLGELLDWAAHEGGWSLRFADPAIEAEARALTLHGSLSGLDLREAQIRSRLTLLESPLAAEELGAGLTQEGHPVAFDFEHRSFAQGQDRGRILLVILAESSVTSLAHVGRVGIRIEVMRVNLEWHQSQTLEGGRIDDRHVVRRHDRWTGDVRACAGTHVRHTRQSTPANRLDELQVPQRLQQSERVATADKDPFSAFNGLDRVVGLVDRVELQTHLVKPLAGAGRVGVPIGEGVGDEEHTSRLGPAEKAQRLGGAVFEVVGAVRRRGADQQEMSHE